MSDKSNDTQFVGASIPDKLFQLINLYSFAHGDAKNHIIKKALQGWVKSNSINEENLIQKMVWDYAAAWRRMDHSEGTFSTFLESVEQELSRRKVSQKIINKLITKLKDEEN